MATTDPILNALSRMEERIVERVGESIRDMQLEMNAGFDEVYKRLERLEQEYEMLKVAVGRLEADVATLKADVATLKADVAFLKTVTARLEARQDAEALERTELRNHALDFHRRIGLLEERAREVEGRLPPG
jgi:chromosome segregation ATPase